jgi:uncharacterized membrane-anchored protein YhcB (DUF1043 family)
MWKAIQLVNQWGRESDFRPGRRGVSAAMTVIAVIFALVIGVAGGYAAFRFSQTDTGGVVNTPADDAQIIELEAKIAGQAGELDAMAEKLDALSITAQLAEEKIALAEKLAREVYTLAAENETLKAKLVAAEAERDAVNQDASVAEDRDTAELAVCARRFCRN